MTESRLLVGQSVNGRKSIPFFLSQIHLDFEPKIKGRIHTDEKIIHVRKELMYDLNSIDSKTKYVLAHLFVEKRTRKQCRALFKQIKDTCYKQILDMWKKEKKTYNICKRRI